jgi:hypothetical protein
MGSDIYWRKPPNAFWIWFDELKSKYHYVTIEILGGKVAVCRVRTPIESPRTADKIKFGKIVVDDSGTFFERTFVPKYYVEEDVVKPLQ